MLAIGLAGAMVAALGACNFVAGIETIGVVDGGTSSATPDAGTCVPQPVLLPPRAPVLAPAACTAQEDSDFLACYLAGDDVATCAAAEGANCGPCILAPEASTTWGALLNISLPSIPPGQGLAVNVLNLGGCVLRADTTAAGEACGNAVESLIACEVAACAPYCPLTSASDTQGEARLLGSGTMDGCVESSDGTSCAGESSTASTACLTSNAYNECLLLRTNIESGTDVESSAAQFLQIMCGG